MHFAERKPVLFILLLAVCAIVSLAIFFIWSYPAVEQTNSVAVQTAIVSEDVRRSLVLYVAERMYSLQKAIDTYGLDRQQHKLFKQNKQLVMLQITDGNPPIDAPFKQANASLKRLFRTHSKQLQPGAYKFFEDRSNAYVAICSARKGATVRALFQADQFMQIKRNSEQNLRLQPSASLKGVHIRSLPAEQANQEVIRHRRHVQQSHYHKRQIVVKFKQIPSPAQQNEFKHALNVQVIGQWGNIFVYESATADVEQLKAYFKRFPVEYIESHYLYTTNAKEFRPNDRLFSPYQWNLPKVKAVQAWRATKGKKQVTVAIVDTGVDLTHPDLKKQLVSGHNEIAGHRSAQDDVGHGTHVAGIIGATVNNVEGIAGLSWYNSIMPVKVLDETGSGQSIAVAKGIIWATDRGAKVINLSLGNYVEGQFLHDAVKYAYARDVVLVAASGNENTDQAGFPAAYPEVLAVTAIDEQNQRAPFANYGSHIDLAAPGVHIASTYPDQAYAALSGTSMAAPHVTGIAALLRSAYPKLKNKEVMEILKKSATDLGRRGVDPIYGAGLINGDKAFQLAKQYLEKPRAISKNDIAEQPMTVWSLFQHWLEWLFAQKQNPPPL